MNDPQSQPDLTAYALGELDHANDAAVHAWLREHPEAQHEVDAISDLAHALQATAPISSLKLHPTQRHAVLSGPERVREMVAAASRRARETSRPPIVLRLLVGSIKTGLAASIVAGAFFIGKSYQNPAIGTLASNTPASAPQVENESRPILVEPVSAPNTQSTPVELVSVAKVPDSVPAPSPEVPAAPVVVAAPPPVTAPAPVEVAVAPVPVESKQPEPRKPEAITRIAEGSVVNASQAPASQFNIAPGETRPRIHGGQGFASPASPLKGKAVEPTSKTKSPTLLIHSWRAEVTSSPWDSSKKLVRISLQIPGEQAAAAADHLYGLQVNFHPTHIRSYRLLGQRAIPAIEKDGAAAFSAWYEVTLNGAPSSATRTIGNVTLANARFTVTALAPFDGTTRLQLVDQGQAWENAADDFVFESAVLGWGMLLTGKQLPPGLSHGSILNLAEHALKTSDRQGERARFVKLLKDARRAAGA